MSDAAADEVETPPKASKMPLILGLVLAVVAAAGGFYATWSGLILSPEAAAKPGEAGFEAEALPDISFVEVEPLVIALPNGAENTHLRFRTQLEVPTAFEQDVRLLLPRVVDVLNSYLRALRVSDIENPSALARLRAQMLRRVQIVTGRGRVNDLLIMEFVVN